MVDRRGYGVAVRQLDEDEPKTVPNEDKTAIFLNQNPYRGEDSFCKETKIENPDIKKQGQPVIRYS